MTDTLTPATVDADVWNRSNPVGTPVTYWPGLLRGDGQRSVTSTPARDHHGRPVVEVEDWPHGLYLTHVTPISQQDGGASDE